MATTIQHIINSIRLSVRVRNALIIRLMGGGNLLALNSSFTHTAGYCPHRGGRRLMFCMALCAVVLLCGGCRQRATFGGVVVQGTPWGFAMALDEQGDGSFLPQCVEWSSYNSAVISGWYDTCATLPRDSVPADLDSYAPTRIMCDLHNGRIVHIAVYCDDEQTPRFTLNLQSEP